MPDQDPELARLDLLLRKRPDDPKLHAARTARCIRLGDWRGLRSEIEWSLHRLKPEQAAYDRSYLSLLFGEMPEGWDRYEARYLIPGLVRPKRSFAQPTWDGSPFAGRTLLLHAEQGFGDTLMFVRYAPRVKALGGRVCLLAQRELADLVATCAGLDAVIPEGAPLPEFDLQLPLPSLPRVFRTTLGTVPGDVPYLEAPPQVPNREAILEALAPSAGRRRIACAWSGNPGHRRDRDRSIPPKVFAQLGALPETDWFAFQPEARSLPPLPGLRNLGPHLKTFSDTAFALKQMDLVVTVDTALAHLAGALALPVRLLVHFQPDFRWLLDRDDSPWYPRTRIYRQPQPGQWEPVLQAVRGDLLAERPPA